MSNQFWPFCIVVACLVYAAYHKHLKYRSQAHVRDPETDAKLSRLQSLEDRVRVLERIVTENKFDLRDEINKL